MAIAPTIRATIDEAGVTETLLDLRGMRCPWPALRVAKALREAGQGDTVIAVADDPAAPREIGAVAAERGWRIAEAHSAIGPALLLSN